MTDVERFIDDAEAARLIGRFTLWFSWWNDIALDLQTLGVAPETVMRASQQLLDLAAVVAVVNRLDGAAPEQPSVA
jgi:hypothetical protein